MEKRKLCVHGVADSELGHIGRCRRITLMEQWLGSEKLLELCDDWHRQITRAYKVPVPGYSDDDNGEHSARLLQIALAIFSDGP